MEGTTLKYSCKIRKVCRCKPAVSNETILATRQEFFFTKIAIVQSGGAHIPTTTRLWKVCLWSLYYHHILAAGNLGSIDSNKTQLKSNTLKYGYKIRKVCRCKPAVSNETILATRQEFFFTKVALVQSKIDIVLLLD